MSATVSEQEARIINALQGGFPLVPRPFEAAGAPLGLSSFELRTALADLLTRRVLTRFGPMVQVEQMGGRFVLAALSVPQERFEAVAASVNAFDVVAHNYRREHPLNMWFVVATASEPAMKAALDAIEAATGLSVYAFPKIAEYFVGMRFTVGGEAPVGRGQAAVKAAPVALSEADWALVRATQAGLPLVEEPWRALAAELGCTEAGVIEGLSRLLAAGVIRRIGAVPNHYAIGYRFNAMAVFDVDDAAIDALGPQVGALDFVTHAYQRPRRLPQWPYNLFAMCHGATRESVLTQVAEIRALLGGACRAHDTLFSTRILKKAGVRL